MSLASNVWKTPDKNVAVPLAGDDESVAKNEGGITGNEGEAGGGNSVSAVLSSNNLNVDTVVTISSIVGR